jgi:DNA relaxase NicK
MDGFQQACSILLGDIELGRMDFGGEVMRGWVRVNFTGQGCQWVSDWDAIADLEALPAAEPRRLDLALTTWLGEVTHHSVVEAHTAGLFRTGGRPPALKQITSSDPRAGRTCEIGKREKAAKFARCYEKGFQLCGQMGPLGESMTHIDGFAVEDIYRCETEYKATDAASIPWEAIERRDSYFAGSYPYFAQLLPGVESDILLRRPERQPQTDLKRLLANVRTQYGSGLFTALVAYHGDIGRVWDQIVGREHHADLLASGVLQVEHD